MRIRAFIRGLLHPEDPHFCRSCGKMLVRGESEEFDPATGARRPKPYAKCPVIGTVRFEGSDGWCASGNWPQHTAVFREPRWSDGS